MKTLTTNEVMNALINNQSLDYNGDELSYYLHITDDGEILPGLDGADYTIICPVEYTDDNETAWAKESADDADFMAIIKELTEEANEYLAQQ